MLNGSPLSYWAGESDVNPMRPAGGLIVGDIERSRAPASLNQSDAPVTVPADHVSAPVIIMLKLWIVQRTRTEQGLLTARARCHVHVMRPEARQRSRLI